MNIKKLLSSLVIGSLLLTGVTPILADDPPQEELTREQIFRDLNINNSRIISEETLGVTENRDITYDFSTPKGISDYEKYIISKSPGYRPGNSITNLDIPDDPDDVRESNILLSSLIREPYNLKTKEQYVDLAKDLDYGVYKNTQDKSELMDIITEEKYGKFLVGSSLNLPEIQKISDKPSLAVIHNHVTMSLVGKNILMESEAKDTWYKKLSPEAKNIVGSRIKVVELNGKRNETLIDLSKIFKTKSYKVIAASKGINYDKDKNIVQLSNDNTELEVVFIKYYDKGLGRSSYLVLSIPTPVAADDRYGKYLESKYRDLNLKETDGQTMSLIGNIQVLRGSTSIIHPFLPLFMNDAKVYDTKYEKPIKELTEFGVKHYNTFKNDVVQDVNYYTPNKKQTVWKAAFGDNATNTAIIDDNGATINKQIAKSFVYRCEDSKKSLLQEEFESATRETLQTGTLYELEILYINAYEQQWINLETIFQVYEEKLKSNIQENNGVLVVDKKAPPVLNVFLKDITNDDILKITEDNFFILKDKTGKCNKYSTSTYFGNGSSNNNSTKPENNDKDKTGINPETGWPYPVPGKVTITPDPNKGKKDVKEKIYVVNKIVKGNKRYYYMSDGGLIIEIINQNKPKIIYEDNIKDGKITEEPCDDYDNSYNNSADENLDKRLVINIRGNKPTVLGRTRGSYTESTVPTYQFYSNKKNSYFNRIITDIEGSDILKEIQVTEGDFQKQFSKMYMEDIQVEIYDENGEIINPEVYDNYADKVAKINKIKVLEFEKLEEKSFLFEIVLLVLIVLLFLITLIYIYYETKQIKIQEKEEKRINTYRFITQGVSDADIKVSEEIINADYDLIKSQKK